MEKLEIMFRVSSFNKIPYGISISIIRALPHLDVFGFKVNYKKLRENLKDLGLFYNSKNMEMYVRYVLKNSIEYFPATLKFTTEYDLLRENCEYFQGNLILFEEYLYMQKIYSNFIDIAIDNYLAEKLIFPLNIDINKADIEELYKEIKGNKKKVDKFIESFGNFFIYNGFVLYQIRVIFLDEKETIKLTFFELSNDTTSNVIKSGEE